jgi:hypothetical protein
LRKVLIVCVALIVLAAGTLLALPRFIDLDWYRGTITAELRRTTGLPVEIAGPLALSLLPTPRLSAAAVTIANPAGAAIPDLLRATRVEARLALLPLVAGKLVFRSLTLVDPVLDRTHLPQRPPDFALERLTIANGTITGGERIEGLDLTATLAEPGGPAHAAGALTLRGTHLDFELDLDRIAARMPFRLALAMPSASHLLLSGDVAAPGGPMADGAMTIDAKAKLSGEDFAAFARLARHPMPAVLARPFTATATVTGSTAALRLDALDIAVDDMHATGALQVTTANPANLTLSLIVNQLDLDRLAGGARGDGEAAPFAALLPSDLGGQLDLGVGALRWHGGIIRDARLQATLDHGAIDVPRLAATLPGGAAMSLSGRLDGADGQRQFRGAVELDSDNLRALLDWLGMSTAAIPADRLRKLTLSSQFTALADRAEIGSLDLTVDATRLTGAATVALRQRPAIGARLAIDQLNLDAYLPSAPPAPAQAQAPSGYAALLDAFDANIDAAVETLTWRGQPARGMHLAATLQDGALTLRQATIADLAGANATASGALGGLGGSEPAWHATIALHGPEIAHIVRLVAPDSLAGQLLSGPFTAQTDIAGERGGVAVDLALAALGGQARITGEIADSAAKAPGIDLGVEISHPSFAALLRNLAPGYQPAGGDPGAVKLSARLSETKGLLSARDMTLAIGGLSVEGDTIFEQRGERPKLSADLRFGELALDRFLPVRQTASLLPAPPLWLAQAGPGATVPGAAARRWSREPFALAALALVDSDISLSGEAFSWGKWRIERPIAVVTLANGLLHLDRLSGGIFGGTVDASVQLATDGQAKLDLAVRHAALEQALQQIAGGGALAGRADVDLGLTTSGLSAAELVGHLQGKLTLASRDGMIAGIDLAAVGARLAEGKGATDLPGLVRGLSGGRTHYRTLDGSFRIADGIMRSDDLHLLADGAEGRAEAALDLPNWLIHSRTELRLTDPAAAPPLALTLDGPIDAPHMVFDVNALESYLAQRGAGRLPVRPVLREPSTNPAR